MAIAIHPLQFDADLDVSRYVNENGSYMVLQIGSDEIKIVEIKKFKPKPQ